MGVANAAPTTALDVTVEAAVLDLIAELQKKYNTAAMYISHNLGVVARVSDKVAVMYAGEIVETADVASLFAAPSHPYTNGLLACLPIPGKTPPGAPLGVIPGMVPRIAASFTGCAFRERCGHALPRCAVEVPPMMAASPGSGAACWLLAREETA